MARPKKTSASDSAAAQLTQVLMEVLASTGSHLDDIEGLIRQARAARRSVKRRRAQWSAESSARALFVWHTDPVFLDGTGKPKPLQLRGPTESLESLLRRCNRGVLRQRDLHLLCDSASLTRHGKSRFVPVDHFVDLKGHRDLLLHFACLSAARLLRTALGNATRKGNSTALIERSAYVTQLPATLIPQFRQLANAQGAELIKMMDRWLEKHRVPTRGRSSRIRTRLAGLHVFGFVD